MGTLKFEQGHIADKSTIEEFLKKFKKLVRQKGLKVPRPKNYQALIDLGLTKKNRKNILLSLSAENYFKGPSNDKDRSGKVWEFGVTNNEQEIYIKLKIAEYQLIDELYTREEAICLSFHQAEYTINYPYKK